MIRKRFASYYFTARKRTSVACIAPQDAPMISTVPDHGKSLRLSLIDDLIRRGCLSSAKQVVRKIIARSPSALDTMSTVDFAAGRGMEVGLDTLGVVVRKLVELDEPGLASAVYCDRIIARGIEPDTSIINSMVICFAKLGKLEDARILFDKLISNGSVPCTAAYNVIFREFYVREMFLEAFDYFVRIEDGRVQLGMWCYNILIDGLCFRGCVGEAIKVFDIMRERTGLLPTLHNYKSLFYGLCKRGWVVEAESVLGDMETQGFFVDKIIYTSLINSYIKDNNIKMAVRFFFRMLKMGCVPDAFTYTVLIQGIAKMGSFDKGWILHDQMNELRMLPDAVTYHVMINNYCKVRKVDCAAMLLNNMAHCNLVPSVHSYTSLVAALYKDNKFSEVDQLCIRMLEQGVVPDHILFLVIMNNSRKGNELQLTLLMLQEILKHGCGLDPSFLLGSTNLHNLMNLEQQIEHLLEHIVRSNLSLANVAFCICITALCESKKIDAALACFRRMVDVGCNPLPFTFNSLIKCIFQDRRFEPVESLFDIMLEWGLVPDMATYLIMINECCKRKDVASAFYVLDQMEKRGLKPSVAIYDSIISCLSREKRLFEAETLFLRMLEGGVKASENFYMTVINGYFRNGRASEVHVLFEMMMEHGIKPSSHSYTALISGLVKSNLIDEGCVYLDRMFRDGFVPNAVLYTSLICHFLRKREFEFAFRLVDLMHRSQIEFDLILYVTLVRGICRHIAVVNKRFCTVTRSTERAREKMFRLLSERTLLPREKNLRIAADSPDAMRRFALKLIQKIKETRFTPNLYHYNGIISGFCWANMIDDAYSQLELMQKAGIVPNEATFTNIIAAHIRVGEIDGAVELFNLMNANYCRPDIVTCKTLLRGLCKAGRELDASSLFLAMRKRGFLPGKASYESLLRCFCACNLSNEAFKIFEEMLEYNFFPRQYSTHWLLHILYEEAKLDEARLVLDMILGRCKLPDKFATGVLVQTSFGAQSSNETTLS
ncbi:pentatricopeptide repeat-containing protein At5g62370-like isoform X1 [Euphorbia lathyris]|uniref:pentatricopeptide repeat-containing protein At5g62370-like isoform X1 n=1 Tax=Euphorbia lathyris TaxID=212925 RepID=UPI003313715A